MAALTTVCRRSARFVAVAGLGALVLAVLATHVLDLTSVSGQSDTITVNGHDSLAVGLQDVYTVVLSANAPSGGLAVTVDSNETNCVVANTPSATGGAGAITVTVPAGRRRATFVAQTVSGASGTCDITATAAGWVTGSAEIDLVQGRLRIRDLSGHRGPLSGDDPFFVEVGVPTGDGQHIRYLQERSKQFGDLDVTVCSDAPSVGTVVNVFGVDVGSDGCEDNPVRAPFSRTVPGEFQFAPLAGNSTPVGIVASAPGFIDDERSVSVGNLSVSVSGADELGAGLQDSYGVRLSDDAPSNLTVTISVPNDDDCVVAEGESSLGATSITRTIAQGRYRAEFFVQGVAATAPGAPCVVTVDAGSFGTDTIAIDVVVPALRLRDVPSTMGQNAATAPIYVETGVPDARFHGLRHVQQVAATVAVTVASSDKTIATIVDATSIDNGSDGEETADVEQSYSRTVPGALKVDAVAGSSTAAVITASAPGFIFIDQSQKEVIVKTSALRLAGGEELAASLQDDYRVELHAASGHPAATVTLTSLTPDLCKVAPNANTAGTNSIDQPIAAGDSSADFVVQAAEMIADVECQIQATASGYESATLNVMIRQAGIRIRDLRNHFVLSSPNDPFVVEVGLPSSNGRDLRRVQRSRPGTSIAFDVCSSDKTVGTIVNVVGVDTGSDGCESDSIVATYSRNVPGNLQFDTLGFGSTTVTATAAGFLTVDTGIVEIRVGGESVHLSLPAVLGSGLQAAGALRLTAAAGSGGSNVTITSDTPDKCLVAQNAATTGSTSITVAVAAGQRTGDFVVSALEGLDDVVCRVTASATGYQSDTDEVAIVAAGLQIVDLDGTTGTSAGPDVFSVQIGPSRENGKGIRGPQPVRIGGVAVPVTVCSEDPTIVVIVGASGNCRTQDIVPGSYQVAFTLLVVGNSGSSKITVNGGGDTETKTVRVAPTAVNLRNGPKVLGTDLQGTYDVTVSNNNGATVTAHAAPATTCVLSTDPLVAGDGSDKVLTIPANTRRATLIVQALEAGPCTVTLSGTTFAADTTDITVIDSRLRIRALSSSIGARAANDPFLVEIGPRNVNVTDVDSNRDNRTGILGPQPRRAGAPLSIQVCSSDPALALVYDIAHTPISSPPVPQCVSATIGENQSSIGNFEFDPLNNGTVDVTSYAPLEPQVDDTVFSVDVRGEAMSFNGPDSIGNNLQSEYSVSFTKAPPAGTSVVIDASGGGCGLSLTRDGAPQSSITLPIPSGRSRGDFWVQGLAELPCSIAIGTAPTGYSPISTEIEIVTPAVQIRGLDSKVSSVAPNQPFKIVIGLPGNNLRDVRTPQEVRPNYAGLPVTDTLPGVPLKVCSSNTDAGYVVGGIADGNCRKGVIAPLHDTLEVFAFDPNMSGTTDVTIELNGVPLILTTRAKVTVNVVAATITVQPGQDLGRGLQEQYNAVLSKNAAADSSVTIESLTPTVCYVAPDDDGPFGSTTSLTIKKGRIRASFSVQSFGTGDECVLRPTTTASGYSSVDRTLKIVSPTVKVSNLDTSMALLAKNDPFDVDLGLPGPRLRSMTQVQIARYGGSGVPVKVCSSDVTVAVIPGAGVDGCKTVTIPELGSRTPAGSLELDPVGTGSTTVCASTPGYVPILPSCRDVRVADVVINLNGRDDVGSYLQDEYVLATSPATNGDFVITSLTPELCKLSVTGTTAGVNQITVTIPQGRGRVPFTLQGIGGMTGLCKLSATGPAGSGITDGYREVNIVAPAARIINLDSSRSTTSPNDPFNVQVGVPNRSLASLANPQVVRVGGGAIPVSVCTTNGWAYGIIVGEAVDHCKVVYIAEGESQTAEGDLSFDSIDEGTATVCVQNLPAGFITVTQSCRDIVISGVVTNINGNEELGAGLQDDYVLALSKGLLADTTFTLYSNANCALATSATVAAANPISITIPAGKTRAVFNLRGLIQGSCDITVTAGASSGVVDGIHSVEIVQPGLRIVGLDTTRSTTAPNDPFNVEIGIPQASLRGLKAAQDARTGGGTVPVKVCSLTPSVAIIVGAGADHCKTVNISERESLTNDPDLALDVQYGGTAVICASSPGYITTDQGCREVRVSPVVANINGHDQIGAGLQEQYVLATSDGLPAATTFTVTTLTSAICKVATGPTAAGANEITVTIAKNRSRADFVIQALGGAEGTCIVIATPPAGSGVVQAYREIAVDDFAARIFNLDGSLGTLANNDPFNVQVGYPDRNLRGLAFAQAARIGGGSIALEVCSSNTAVGVIVGAAANGCKTVSIPEGKDRSNDGDLIFDPIIGGTTIICVGSPVMIEQSCREVRVSSVVANINGRDDVGAGLQEDYTLFLNQAVPADSTFTIASNNTDKCLVANTASGTGVASISVIVPKNRAKATFFVQGVDPGQCQLVVTPPAASGIYGSDRTLTIAVPALRIVNLDASRGTQAADDPFHVEVGLPQASGRSLSTVQAVRTGNTVAVTVCSTDYNVGTIVGGSAGCKTVNVNAGQTRTADGALAFDSVNEGDTTVCATAPGFIGSDAACHDVAVSGLVPNIDGPDAIGATLQDEYTLSLNSAVAADTVMTVTSATTATCRVSATRSVAGSTSINLTIPAGRSRVGLWVQGWDSAGLCTLNITTAASGIAGGTRELNIVAPGLRIINLASTIRTTSDDDPFDVELGIPSGNLRTLSRVQERRGGAPNLTVNACSSATAYATVVGPYGSGACRYTTVLATQDRTAAGAFAMHAVLTGNATIYAYADGFITTDAGYKDITVSSGSVTIAGGDAIGAGLQDTFTVNVSPRAPSGGLPITVTSLTTSLCKVAANISTAGNTSYSVTLAKGKTNTKIAIQAIEGVAGTCIVRTSSSNGDYVGADFEVDIRQPAVRIRSLDPTTTIAAANDGFFIDVGVARDNLRSLRLIQTVRAGAPSSLTVQACSSNTNAGVVIGTATANAACKSATIGSGASGTATNALQFDPVGPGTTIITASASGFLTTQDGAVEVFVASAALSMTETSTDRIGAGLMETFNIKSSATVGVNTTVAITSQTPDVCLVALNETSTSASSINAVIAAGRAKETFVIHGVENKSGACVLRATSSGFGDGFASFDVAQPALRIQSLGMSKSQSAADDPFNVDVGVAKPDLSNIQTIQKVRYGSSGVSVKACSTEYQYVGKLVGGGADGCLTVTITAGNSETATNALKFDTLGGGLTVVDATAAGFIVTDAGTVEVTVSGDGLSLDITSSSANPVGAGLQRGTFNVGRTGSTSAAITTTVTSLTPGLCKVATSGSSAGAPSISVAVASGSTTSAAFWIQGQDGVSGVCELSVTHVSYPSGGTQVVIVRPALRLLNLAGSIANTAANDAFNVEIGVANADQSNLAETQQVRYGSAGFVIPVINDNSAAAQLIGSDVSNVQTTGQSATVKIVAGQFTNTTGAQQRLEFDPNNALAASAGTAVSATHPECISTTAASQVVVVVVGSGC